MTIKWMKKGPNILHSLFSPSITGVPYSSLNDLYDLSYDYGEAANMVGE